MNRGESGIGPLLGLLMVIAVLLVAIIVAYVSFHFLSIALGGIPFGEALAALIALVIFLAIAFGAGRRFV